MKPPAQPESPEKPLKVRINPLLRCTPFFRCYELHLSFSDQVVSFRKLKKRKSKLQLSDVMASIPYRVKNACIPVDIVPRVKRVAEPDIGSWQNMYLTEPACNVRVGWERRKHSSEEIEGMYTLGQLLEIAEVEPCIDDHEDEVLYRM